MGENQVVITSVGPVKPEVRDRLKQFRDDRGHPNYNAALSDLLDDAPEDTSHKRTGNDE